MPSTTICLSITGIYQAETTSVFTNLLAASDIRVLDVEQRVIHFRLFLSFLIAGENLPSEWLPLTEEAMSYPIFRDLYAEAKKRGLSIQCRTVPPIFAPKTDDLPPSLVTLVGLSLDFKVIAQICSLLTHEQISIQGIKTLARGQFASVEIEVSSKQEIKADLLIRKFHHIVAPFGIDVFIQEDKLIRRAKRMIVLDMDSTLTQIEVIDELAKEANVGEKIVSITARAMNGEISFPEALRERVRLLKGLPVSALETVYRRMPLTSGAEKLLRVLQKIGCKTAVLSGGFDYFTERIKKSLRLDYAYSNRLEIKEGVLTGRIIGEIVDGEKKRALMEEIAQKEGIPLNQVIAVGDGANDLPMITHVGLGIAFNAKPAVRAVARHNLTQKSLLPILYLLGFTEKEIEEDS